MNEPMFVVADPKLIATQALVELRSGIDVKQLSFGERGQ